jgi:DNA-binding beta-propeller fold protein YncE
MMKYVEGIVAACVVALTLGATTVQPQIVVSANDAGKQVAPAERTADSVTVLSFDGGKPTVLGSVAAPGSIQGPPVSVAVTRDEKLALVTNSTRIDPADVNKYVSDDVVSVIDISAPRHPVVRQTLHSGPNVQGIAVNRAGTLALAANTDEDTVSILTVEKGVVALVGKVQLDKGARPASINFFSDGKGALVLCGGTSKIMKLSVAGTRVDRVADIPVGLRSSSLAVVLPGEKVAIVKGVAPAIGQAPPLGKAVMIDLTSGRVVTSVELGVGPEHIALSQDGAYLEATLHNGSHDALGSPHFHDFGLMKVFRVGADSITPVAQIQTGHWCQGALWSLDNRTLLLQCSAEKDIEVYRFDGRRLSRDPSATVQLDAAPAAMATAMSR